MEKNILNEELSISNDVNNITTKIKSAVSNDYKKNKDDLTKYKPIDKKLDDVFYNELDINYNNIIIKVVYYVLNTSEEKTFRYYKGKYASKSRNTEFHLTLFLTGYNGVINWKLNSMSLQHEVEHLYQLYKKKKPLLSSDKMKDYNNIEFLMDSDDFYDNIVGFTYYYYFKIERNANINGLYRKIMDANEDGVFVDPMEIIKDSLYYQNVQFIKKTIQDSTKLPLIEKSLLKINKSLKSYLRVANRMIDEYTKAFGRLLYKTKKDIEKEKSNWLINYGERLIKKD